MLLDVVAAGRSRERLAGLGVPVRVATAADPAALAAAFEGACVVVNAAGPFHLTAAPVLAACIKAGAHSVDVGGEGPVFEALMRYDEPARRAGVMVMPGAGYVMAASDALAPPMSRGDCRRRGGCGSAFPAPIRSRAAASPRCSISQTAA